VPGRASAKASRSARRVRRIEGTPIGTEELVQAPGEHRGAWAANDSIARGAQKRVLTESDEAIVPKSPMDPRAREQPSSESPRDQRSPGQSSRPKGQVALPVALAVVGFLLAWTLTGPTWLAQINWDNGAYLASMASGKSPWASMPWNAHFGIGHVYWLGARVARLWGGSYVDGFRLADALAFAITCAFVASASLHLAGRRLVAALVTGFWMTSWVMVFLLLTLEDNILFLAPAAAVIWLCVARLERWRLGESLAAGVAAGVAFLMSWQAILYLAPGFGAALISPGGGSLRRRLGCALAIAAAFVATLCVYCLVLASATPLHAHALAAQLFSRPTGSLGVRSVFDVRGQLRALGVATLYFAEHTAFDLPHTAVSPEFIGKQVMVGQIALVGWLIWRLWGSEWTGDRRAPLLGATLLLFTAVTPLHLDTEYRYLVRYDFVPFLKFRATRRGPLVDTVRSLPRHSSQFARRPQAPRCFHEVASRLRMSTVQRAGAPSPPSTPHWSDRYWSRKQSIPYQDRTYPPRSR
jgi:hypothetical protein